MAARQRNKRFLINGIKIVFLPVVYGVGMGGADGTVLVVDILDGTFEISINLFIAVETAGKFSSVGIRINADGQHVIGVVIDGIVFIFPVERMIFLTVKEENFIIRELDGVEFSGIRFDVFDRQSADIVVHVAHHGIDGTGSGVAAEPVKGVHVDTEFVVFLVLRKLSGRGNNRFSFAVFEPFKIGAQVAHILFPERHTAVTLFRFDFGEEQLSDEIKSFSPFGLQNKGAVTHSGIHVGTEDFPGFFGKETALSGSLQSFGGILSLIIAHDAEGVAGDTPADHFIGGDFFGNVEKCFAFFFNPRHHVAHAHGRILIHPHRRHMTVDKLCITGFMRNEIRCPALIILVHEKQDTAAFDPFGDIGFIVFDIIIETVLFNDGDIVFIQITGQRIINFFNIVSFALEELGKGIRGTEPVFEITELHFLYSFFNFKVFYALTISINLRAHTLTSPALRPGL